MNLSFVLLFVAIVLFGISAANIAKDGRVNLVAAGLFCWALSTAL